MHWTPMKKFAKKKNMKKLHIVSEWRICIKQGIKMGMKFKRYQYSLVRYWNVDGKCCRC